MTTRARAYSARPLATTTPLSRTPATLTSSRAACSGLVANSTIRATSSPVTVRRNNQIQFIFRQAITIADGWPGATNCWHGAHIQGGPFDVTKILAADPNAMQKPDSPLWGPLHAPHHWGEPLFGYYLTDDEGVLRKHAQMLADAGVDVVIFDVTNQITYRDYYRGLLVTLTRLCRAQN